MNYIIGEYSFVQLTVDEVFEGIKESDSISEVKTRPLEIDARFVKLRE